MFDHRTKEEERSAHRDRTGEKKGGVLVRRWPFLFFLAAALLPDRAGAVSDEALIEAFADVFAVREAIQDVRAPALAEAMRQLDQLGLRGDASRAFECGLVVAAALSANASSSSPCAEARPQPMSDAMVARILMRAALGNLVLGLQDPDDWSVVVADVATGRLERRRSFSGVRFAVLESLLLVAVLALGRVVWLQRI